MCYAGGVDGCEAAEAAATATVGTSGGSRSCCRHRCCRSDCWSHMGGLTEMTAMNVSFIGVSETNLHL